MWHSQGSPADISQRPQVITCQNVVLRKPRRADTLQVQMPINQSCLPSRTAFGKGKPNLPQNTVTSAGHKLLQTTCIRADPPCCRGTDMPNDRLRDASGPHVKADSTVVFLRWRSSNSKKARHRILMQPKIPEHVYRNHICTST